MFDFAPTTWIILAVVNIPLYVLAGKFFFGSWAAFGETLRYAMQPNWASWIAGEWGEDFRAEMKLGVFMGLCSVLVLGEALLLHQITDRADDPPAIVELTPDTTDVVVDEGPRQFTIRRDGTEYGPYPLDQLEPLRSQRLVSDADEFRLDDEGEWLSAAALAERLAVSASSTD